MNRNASHKHESTPISSITEPFTTVFNGFLVVNQYTNRCATQIISKSAAGILVT